MTITAHPKAERTNPEVEPKGRSQRSRGSAVMSGALAQLGNAINQSPRVQQLMGYSEMMNQVTPTGQQNAPAAQVAQRVIRTGSEIDPLPDKYTQAIAKFSRVVESNDTLSFLARLNEQYVLLTFNVRSDMGKAEGYTDIKIKGSGKVKTSLQSTGSDLGALKELLKKGTPKRIVIDVSINDAILRHKEEAYIASVLAHEVGTHIAPYAPTLEKVANAQRLSSGEVSLLQTAHGSSHEQIDHSALHNGYLAANWSPFRLKPMYRELIDALVKTHYSSAEEYRVLWDEYIKDVSRYDISSGRAGAKDRSAQEVFYREYEEYRSGKGSYPIVKKIAANKGLSIATVFGLLLIFYIMLYVTQSLFSPPSDKPDL
jgi:hypothetical protein